ncbi:chloride channel protein [Thalassospira sp. GO-4]|jgi:CIC family chloride channel protein|uniref:Chloride channel protein n=1 Tax=Thalassospira povalilytica TaxID=732237 RepID=A0ABX4RD88_9PROT|nr:MULTISPECIES: chloride channel protein [Thalassospira]PKR52569.1 chloride channel protein [Thalassospira povalilytica]URK17611.1 chloride channel protein [Thalassospira sp. GO-4]
MAEKLIKSNLVLSRLRRLVKSEQLVLSLLALVVGAMAGGGTILFRDGILLVQALVYGWGEESLHQHLMGLSNWHLVLGPTAGGLVVGVFIYKFLPGQRPHGVADVIDSASFNDARMSTRCGIKSAIASAVSLGSGASLGREGPVVHMGASFGAWLARVLHLRRGAARTLLGCGVASAVAASFNAPLAGMFFAHEVVLGHYARTAFAPIVMSSVMGTVITRLYYGSEVAFLIPLHNIQSFWEFPAFALLGLLAGITAMLTVRAIPVVQKVADTTRAPLWCRPAIAGLVVGIVGLGFPQIIGVGYGAMNDALYETYSLTFLIGLLFAKAFVVAICMGLGFAGGMFSPSLFLGAMLGGAFGIVATHALPDFSSGHGAYTLVGMGAVAAAVLGAPISTTLIVFELTGDYQLTIAVMLASVLASVIMDQANGGSFFHWQLKMRGLSTNWGREVNLLRMIKVADIMKREYVTVPLSHDLPSVRSALFNAPYAELFVVDDKGKLHGTITLTDLRNAAFDTDAAQNMTAGEVARSKPPVLFRTDSIEKAIRLMEQTGEEHLPVLNNGEDREMIGFVHEKDAMMAYNNALLELQSEERGDAPPKLF